MDTLAATIKVRNKALDLGFDLCGFARAGALDEEAFRLEEWLHQNRHGTMDWMQRNFDKRTDPTVLVPGAKSVVSVLASYRFQENELADTRQKAPKIAKYARGRDYHKVFKNRLKKLFRYVQDEIGNINGRFFTDSAPVMDKAWAQRAGLGWIGKNSNLLNKTHGSWFLIGEMILDIPFVYDAPETDHCGSCTRCIDACPTDAIYEPFKVDGNRCISYLTIELKDNIPDEFKEQMGEWMFGCDICQDVCPWNRKADYGHIEDLKPREKVLHPSKNWSEITEDEFNVIFEGSPVRRAKYEWFTKNAEIVEKNLNNPK
ncbi:MAG: tRNA epoxyqueuosine(34) reductase QueG [Balneolaceae bacterium]